MAIGINCDMGESFGLYQMGDDEGIMPFITEANVACGFHASDPSHMHRTVVLAKRYGVHVGAHFSFPDLQGFGRRKMVIERQELTDIIIYQIGALQGFLSVEGLPLNHLKPHGALYGMAAQEPEVAAAVAAAGAHFQVPIFGMSGTLHEQVYCAQGIPFRAEFFSDLDYDEQGHLCITSQHQAVVPEQAAARALRAVQEGKTRSLGGNDIALRAESICVHSDTPNAIAIARAIHQAMRPFLATKNDERKP